MLADPRAESLSDDFAFQWLHLSKLDEITPDRGQFPHASGLLDPRALFKEELRLFVDSVLRSDRSVSELLTADYTFLNERLAMLYGICLLYTSDAADERSSVDLGGRRIIKKKKKKKSLQLK